MSVMRFRGAGRLALSCVAAMTLGACASAPTRVTLLPDQEGHVGAVVVSNGQGSQRIDQAYAAVEIAPSAAAPKPPHAQDQARFDAAHRALLDAQPSPPRSFVLNFLFDSMELTPESKRLLPQVLEAVRDRLPTEVTVFGYADAAGTAAYNLSLSAQRARVVAKLLKQIDPELPVDVQYFGDKAPLVPTRPGVPEPRNRRAEIVIL